MRIPIRTMAFAAMAAGVWGADAHYRESTLARAEADGVIRQVNGNGRLAELHQEGNRADDLAIGATALAGVACFATWRPRPRTVLVDRRGLEPVG